jgi:hypothetical protein
MTKGGQQILLLSFSFGIAPELDVHLSKLTCGLDIELKHRLQATILLFYPLNCPK